MSNFLTYSEIDAGIQARMAGAVPSQSTRLKAINDALNDVYAEFDIDSGKRDVVAYLVPNGKPYPISDLVSDFKNPADLRYLASSRHIDQFSYFEEDLFAEHVGESRLNDEYTISYRNGNLFISMLSANGVKHLTLHSMDSLTSNGTWSADAVNSDATNITTTTVTTLNQSECIEFDVDVSQSANHYALISNSSMDAIDLSDYINLGRARCDVSIPTTTNLTSLELLWGSDSSNYYSVAVTTQADGTALTTNWNDIEFDWANATTTGTPVSTAIDYVAFKVNYSASFTDAVKFRIENIRFNLPVPMKLVYYTYYLSKTSGGTFQEEMTTTGTDQLLIPRRYKSLIELAAYKYLIPVAYGDDAQFRLRSAEKEYARVAQGIGTDIGSKQNKPGKKTKMHKW